jgi:Cytochrome P450
MVLYPEVQRKAQAEIDAVVGKDRLPAFEDRPLLPYVSAILEEALRWHPVLPLGTPHLLIQAAHPHLRRRLIFAAVPHRLTTDDVYEGWFLPAGSIIIGNSWWVSTVFATSTGTPPNGFAFSQGNPAR